MHTRLQTKQHDSLCLNLRRNLTLSNIERSHTPAKLDFPVVVGETNLICARLIGVDSHVAVREPAVIPVEIGALGANGFCATTIAITVPSASASGKSPGIDSHGKSEKESKLLAKIHL